MPDIIIRTARINDPSKQAGETNTVEVSLLLDYATERGTRRTPTGAVVPEYFARRVWLYHNDALVAESLLSANMAKRPFLQVMVEAEAGDTVQVVVEDSLGHRLEKRRQIT